MNEGTIALLIQWSLLCLVWMGSFDAQLREMNMERRRVLAVLCAFLICSFVSWKLFFAPIQVSLSGTLLPLLQVWSSTRASPKRREDCMW